MSNTNLTPPVVIVAEDEKSDEREDGSVVDGDSNETKHVQNGSVKSRSSENLSRTLSDDHVVDVDDTQTLTATKLGQNSVPKHVRPLSRRSSMENFGLVSLLTPALPVLPGIQGNDAWAKKFRELQDEHRDLVLAAAHIDDALRGRGAYGKARAIFKAAFPQKCFYVIDNKWWRRTVALFIVLYSILPLWESPHKDIQPGMIEVWVIALEVLCIAVLIIDLTLNIIFYTWRRFWSLAETKWQRVEFIFTCLFIIDFIIMCTQEILAKNGVKNIEGLPVRLVMPFRCLRAATFMCKTKNVGHIFDVCLSILVKLGKVFLVITLFIMVFAGVGVHLFDKDFHQCENSTRTANTTNCTETFNIYNGAYDHFGVASLQLFVLLTTENYPEFMMPAFEKSSWSFIYFGGFLFVGVFFLTAILLAIIVDNYWAFSKKNVKVERKRERAEIIKAWNILDPLGDGSLSVNDEKLLLLFKELRPQNTEDEIKELIDYVDEDGDAVIDTFEWTTRLTDALNYEFEKEVTLYTKTCCTKCAVRCSESVRGLVQSVALTRTILVLIIVHTILFFIKWHAMSDTAVFVVQGMKTGIIGIFLIEIVLRVIGMGHHLRDLPLEVADIIITSVAIVTNLLWYAFKFQATTTELDLGIITVTSSLFVMIRMGFNSKQTKTMVLTFLQVFPVMFDLTILISIIVYFYSLIGLESFYGYAPSPLYSSSHYEYKCNLGFETLSCSLLVVFQILSTSNWHEIMNATMTSVSGWAWIYFMTCYLITNLVFLNLFVAIAIEAFNKLAATGDELNNTNMMDTLQTAQEDKTFAESAKKFFSNVLASSRSIASQSQLNKDHSHGDHLTVPTTKRQESPSDSEPEDMSGLTFQQKREKLLKKRQQKRKRTVSKIKVVMAFRKHSEEQIDLHVGDEVKILETEGDWCKGEARGRTGWFPLKHVIETVKKNRGRHRTVSPEPPVEEPKVDTNQNQTNPFINKPEDIRPSTQHSRVDDVAQSLMKSRMKKQGGDWRRRIHGDMTVMNHEEMVELNQLVKAELRSNRGQTGSQQRLSVHRENTITEDPETIVEEPTSNSTRVIPQAGDTKQIRVDVSPTLPEVIEEEEEEEEGKLNVEKPRLPKNLKKETKRPGGDMPEWAKKFLKDHSLKVEEDIKVDKNLKPVSDDVKSIPSRPSSARSARSGSAASNKSNGSTLNVTTSAVKPVVNSRESTPIMMHGKGIDPEWGTDTNDSTDKTINAIVNTMDEAEKIESRSSSGRSRSSSISTIQGSAGQREPSNDPPADNSGNQGKRKNNRAALMAKLRR